MHTITKSPFTSQGTTLTVDGGTNSLFRVSGRYAGLAGDKVGFKLSGEYSGPATSSSSMTGQPGNFPRGPTGAGRPAKVRDFDVGRWDR